MISRAAFTGFLGPLSFPTSVPGSPPRFVFMPVLGGIIISSYMSTLASHALDLMVNGNCIYRCDESKIVIYIVSIFL